MYLVDSSNSVVIKRVAWFVSTPSSQELFLYHECVHSLVCFMACLQLHYLNGLHAHSQFVETAQQCVSNVSGHDTILNCHRAVPQYRKSAQWLSALHY